MYKPPVMVRPPTSEELYENFLSLSGVMQSVDVPLDNRVMYYYVISWWRHPIKRWKQKRAIRKLLVTADV